MTRVDSSLPTGRSAPAASRWAGATVLLVSLMGARCAASPVTLEECVENALAYSPAVRGATADVRGAREKVRAARAAYIPKLLGRGEYGHAWGFDEVVTDGGRTAALVTLELSLFDGGLRQAELEAARARVRSAAALSRQQRANEALAVRTAYLTALFARAEMNIQTTAAGELADALTLLEAQEARGLTPRDDVLRAESARETILSAGRAAAATTAASLSELSVLTGDEVAAADLLQPTVVGWETPTEATIDDSPPVADARSQAEAAHREVDAARSERWGRLGLTGNGGFLGVNPGQTFSENGGGDFLVGYVVPIFDGGALDARIAASEATASRLDANVREARQTIDIALARVHAEAVRAAADAEAWQRTVPRAAEGLQLMRARYFGGGNVRLLEVLDALTQSVDARIAVDRARLAYELARALQHQILGTVR